MCCWKKKRTNPEVSGVATSSQTNAQLIKADGQKSENMTHV